MIPDSASTRRQRRAVQNPEPSAPDAQEAVETFTFEVSAGKKVARPEHESAVPVRVMLPQRVLPSGRAVYRQQVSSSASAATPVKALKSVKTRRPMPAWLGSVLFHAAVILPMGFMTIAGLPQAFDFSLSLSTEPAFADEVMIDEIAIEPAEDFEAIESELTQQSSQVTAVAASELDSQVALADLTSASLADAALGDASALFGAQGSGLAEMVPSGAQLTASFFGTKVDGRRILYVLDNSGGMQGGELEALIEELMRSVESLTPEQEFYVIFYSDMLYPLFYPRPVERFVPANDRFKQRLKTWLDTVEFCQGNEVDLAMQAAASTRPDVIYLLTDGDLDSTRDQRRMAFLLDSRGREFPIHTFGLGTGENSTAAGKLKLVAEANGGTFRAVKVSSTARARAKEIGRPYHDKEPGEVWGLNVGRGWGR